LNRGKCRANWSTRRRDHCAWFVAFEAKNGGPSTFDLSGTCADRFSIPSSTRATRTNRPMHKDGATGNCGRTTIRWRKQCP
jgi:hypothetical protein